MCDVNTAGHNIGAATKQIRPEFGSWPVSPIQAKQIEDVKWRFDELLSHIASIIPPTNGRYLAMVNTKLEEACMLAVKGISKP